MLRYVVGRLLGRDPRLRQPVDQQSSTAWKRTAYRFGGLRCLHGTVPAWAASRAPKRGTTTPSSVKDGGHL
jgi:hypothetical protein